MEQLRVVITAGLTVELRGFVPIAVSSSEMKDSMDELFGATPGGYYTKANSTVAVNLVPNS